MKLRTDRSCHARYSLKYHLIFVTKYRKPCINEEVFETLKQQLTYVAGLHGSVIEEISYEADHVHMLIEIPPQENIANLINTMKCSSSRRVRQNHEEHLKQYLWKDAFWSRSYMILSCGSASIDVIREYIREQGTEAHAKKKAARGG